MIRFYNSSRNTHRSLSVISHFSRIFRLTLIALLAFGISSCEKGILTVGSDILPKGDFTSIKSIDTLSIFSYTMYSDSARTDNSTYSYLGQLYDPYFGSTTAGFVSQLRLNAPWDSLGFTVDSMKLYLHILRGIVGGSTDAPHTLTITEIPNQIYNDSAYYSTTPVTPPGFKLSNIILPKLRTDTINDIVLNLPDNGVEFGNYLIRDTTKWFYNNTVPDFRSYFKGMYFQMDASSDPLMLPLSLIFDNNAYYNYFILYGHNHAGAFKSYSLILDAKNANAAFNIYKHDYTTATLGDKMEHRNTNYLDTLSYLQSLNGVYTKVSLPGLEKLRSDPSFGKVAVNKARLVVPVHFTQTAGNHISTSLPSQLVLRYRAKSGIKYPVNDYTMATTLDPAHGFFDGKLDTINKVYNFNIPAFVQAFLDDVSNNTPPELEIYQGPGTRDVILSANKNKTPVKFEFTYTKF